MKNKHREWNRSTSADDSSHVPK